MTFAITWEHKLAQLLAQRPLSPLQKLAQLLAPGPFSPLQGNTNWPNFLEQTGPKVCVWEEGGFCLDQHLPIELSISTSAPPLSFQSFHTLVRPTPSATKRASLSALSGYLFSTSEQTPASDNPAPPAWHALPFTQQ